MNFKKLYEPFIIIGVLVSLILSLLLVLMGIDTISSILFALLGIVITLQIELIARLEQTLHKNKQYSDLGYKLESIPWLHNTVLNILNSAISICHKNNKLFKHSAKNKLESCDRFLDDLNHGNLKINFDNIEPIIYKLNNLKNSLHAVSTFSSSNNFWKSSFGKKYWNLNLDAINTRNVTITRIFIYDKWCDSLQEMIETQNNAGVKVFTVLKSELPENLCLDMIIFDMELLNKAILNSNNIPIENILSDNKTDIIEEFKNFNLIKNFSIIFKDFSKKVEK